ncbi:hypothetical protein [Burkholderia stabilis]|uniref:hypothetical protein n=1 Tax=Burkholderia stabilis TaxID=95485 RepID=UPI001F0C49AF|nr:hypothetical protein [Burkholderia stabilis]
MNHRHELTRYSAVELRVLLQAREISAVELLEACIARIEALNPYVNAITATSFERARIEAGRRMPNSHAATPSVPCMACRSASGSRRDRQAC